MIQDNNKKKLELSADDDVTLNSRRLAEEDNEKVKTLVEKIRLKREEGTREKGT